MGRTNPNFMNGVPELLILQLLAEREMYGYELVSVIRERSSASISLGEGVIYPVLHGLEHDGALSSRRIEADGRSRIYYRMTARGRRRLTSITDDWRRITDGVRQVLGGERRVGRTV